MNLLTVVKAAFPEHTEDLSIEVGLSGGLDSVVLLHVLARLRAEKSFRLNAVHVHHGLSPSADEWADFCRTLCRRLDVPLRVAKVSVSSRGKGTEAAARAQRYQVFSDGLSPVLALAHHQDDQIETFLLGVARGGGMRALAAMPKWRALTPHIRIWRPLLEVDKAVLAQYAAEHGLPYVSDESNQDTAYLRNWIRHQALPQWQDRVPHLNRQILANIRGIQDDLALLDEVTQADYSAVVSDGLFDVAKWRGLGELRRHRVLHHLFALNTIRLPSRKTISDMAGILQQADAGQWQFDETRVEYYRGKLYVLNTQIEHSPWMAGNPLQGRLKDILLQSGFVLKPHRYGLSEKALLQQGRVRQVNAADKVRLGAYNKSVKKLLQENHILPSVRKIWPIITNSDNHCLAVANLTANQDFQAFDGFLPVYEPFERFFTELNTADKVIA